MKERIKKEVGDFVTQCVVLGIAVVAGLVLAIILYNSK